MYHSLWLYKKKRSHFIFALILGVVLAVAVSVWATSIGTNISVTGNLVVDGTSTSTFGGSVAIGTTTPIATLSVDHTSGSTAFAVGSSTATSFLIDSGGRIGVGTANPFSVGGLFNLTGTHLNVRNPSSLANLIAVGGIGGSLVLGDDSVATDNKIMQLISLDGITYFRSLKDSGSIQADHALVLQHSNGNVGIGTSSPYAKLSVVGETVFPYFTATSTTATSSIATGGFTVGSSSQFLVQQNSGNVGIGTSTPSARFSVSGDMYSSGSTTVTRLGFAGSGATITGHVSASASVDIGVIAASSCAQATMAVSGAADGDTVLIGAPNALFSGTTGSSTFSMTAFVSAADTVTIRLCQHVATGANPDAVTIRADVWKH